MITEEMMFIIPEIKYPRYNFIASELKKYNCDNIKIKVNVKDFLNDDKDIPLTICNKFFG
jgi:hypothetical protein